MTSNQHDDDIWSGLDDDDFMSINCSELQNRSCDNCESNSHSPVKYVASPSKTSSRLGSAEHTSLHDGTPKKRRSFGANGSVAVPSWAISPYTSMSRYVRKKRPSENIPPLQRYRYGRLWVTHLIQQYWCEQQMVYNFDPPIEMLDVEIVTPPQVTTGATLHLARELQIHDIVEVKVTSAEDRFAIKLINLLDSVVSILQFGCAVAREIPVFGTPFDLGVFVIGTIDEIRCSQGTLDLELREFKTRTTASMPTDAQKMTHELQVMLYKEMFDSLVRGSPSKETVAKHMKLNLKKALGNDVVKLCGDKSVFNLSLLFDKVFDTMKAVPFITSLFVEYVMQENSTLIGEVPVLYDEDWLREKLVHAMSYWKGERPPRGVDIEECWKCQHCSYSEVCAWKSKFPKAPPVALPAITTLDATSIGNEPEAGLVAVQETSTSDCGALLTVEEVETTEGILPAHDDD